MACIPQTPLMYEAVTILDCRNVDRRVAARGSDDRARSYGRLAGAARRNAWMARARLMVWWVYLPLTAIVLRRLISPEIGEAEVPSGILDGRAAPAFADVIAACEMGVSLADQRRHDRQLTC